MAFLDRLKTYLNSPEGSLEELVVGLVKMLVRRWQSLLRANSRPAGCWFAVVGWSGSVLTAQKRAQVSAPRMVQL
jgi:hypothetical protein